MITIRFNRPLCIYIFFIIAPCFAIPLEAQKSNARVGDLFSFFQRKKDCPKLILEFNRDKLRLEWYWQDGKKIINPAEVILQYKESDEELPIWRTLGGNESDDIPNKTFLWRPVNFIDENNQERVVFPIFRQGFYNWKVTINGSTSNEVEVDRMALVEPNDNIFERFSFYNSDIHKIKLINDYRIFNFISQKTDYCDPSQINPKLFCKTAFTDDPDRFDADGTLAKSMSPTAVEYLKITEDLTCANAATYYAMLKDQKIVRDNFKGNCAGFTIAELFLFNPPPRFCQVFPNLCALGVTAGRIQTDNNDLVIRSISELQSRSLLGFAPNNPVGVYARAKLDFDNIVNFFTSKLYSNTFYYYMIGLEGNKVSNPSYCLAHAVYPVDIIKEKTPSHTHKVFVSDGNKESTQYLNYNDVSTSINYENGEGWHIQKSYSIYNIENLLNKFPAYRTPTSLTFEQEYIDRVCKKSTDRIGIIYPNPWEGEGDLTATINSNNVTVSSISVYNIIGQRVVEVNNPEIPTINLSNLATLSNGIYYVVFRFRDGGKEVQYLKVHK